MIFYPLLYLCLGAPAACVAHAGAQDSPVVTPPADDARYLPAGIRLRLLGTDYGTLYLASLLDERYYHGGFRHWLGNALGNAWQALSRHHDGRSLPSHREEFSDAPLVTQPARNVSP